MAEEWVVNEKFRKSRNPNLETNELTNTFSEPGVDKFLIRGKTYLSDREKIVSQTAGFTVEGINVFRTPEPFFHSAERIKSLKRWLEDHPKNEYFIFSFVLPGPPYVTVVQLFRKILVEGQDTVFDRLYGRFKKEGEVFQKDRFKFVCLVPTAPWALKMAISSLGGEKPVVICNKLTSSHYSGSNYTEIDVDVGSSKVASMLNSLVVGAGSKLLVDMGCIIEGRDDDELPERLLTCVRWHYCDADQIATTLDSLGNVTSLNVSSSYLSSLADSS